MKNFIGSSLAASVIAATMLTVPTQAWGRVSLFFSFNFGGGGGAVYSTPNDAVMAGTPLGVNGFANIGGSAFVGANIGYVSPAGWAFAGQGYYPYNGYQYQCRQIVRVQNGYRIPGTEKVICTTRPGNWNQGVVFVLPQPRVSFFVAVAPPRPVVLPPWRPVAPMYGTPYYARPQYVPAPPMGGVIAGGGTVWGAPPPPPPPRFYTPWTGPKVMPMTPGPFTGPTVIR